MEYNKKCYWTDNVDGIITYCHEKGTLDATNIRETYLCDEHMDDASKKRNLMIIKFLDYVIKNSHIKSVKELHKWLIGQ